MTNQDLIASLDIDQQTGKISFEQWWAMKSGVEKLVMGSVEIDAEEAETGYTETEENCKGCMGPCGRYGDAEVEKVVRQAHGIADSLSKNTSFSKGEQEISYVRDGAISDVMKALDEPGPCEWVMPEIAKQVQMAETIRELKEIVKLGARMRAAQKAYFRNRTSENLEESKRLEREFDRMAAEQWKADTVTVMPTLFP